MQKRLIAGLAAALVVSLLVIAFLIGRMTGNRSVSTVQVPLAGQREMPQSPVPVAAPSVPAAAENEQQPASVQPFRETQPPTRQELTPTREPPPITRLPADTAIASYFAKIDAIHVAGTGDPMTFAQGILSGIEGGDTSGVDSLVESAKAALAQATSVQPPPSCADYHRRLLGVLSKRPTEWSGCEEAIVKSDLNAVTALAPQMQATQQKIEELDRMKKQLLAP